MAFTKAPANSTYDTKDILLVQEINSRGSSNNRDEYYTNVFPESVKNRLTQDKELNLIKRSGSSAFITPSGVGTFRGMFHWKLYSKLFIVIGDDCYVYNSVSGALITTLTNIVAAGTTDVGFCQYLYDTGVVKVVITDGTTLSTIDSANTVVVCVDGDLPTPHLPTPQFFDGYLLLVKTGTADCYNSDLNDPLAWTPGNFIAAEMRADQVTGIVTLNNYFLLLGQESIEYFWDAAIATGSPFQRNDTPIKLSGFIGGLSQFGNKVYLVAEEVEGQPDVFVLEDFKMTPIGNEALRRHLASLDLTNLTGNVVSIDGNDLYVVDTGSLTYFMVIETKLWGLLKYKDESRFALNQAFSINTTNGSTALFTLQGSTVVYKFNPTLYQDSGVDFTCTIVTDTQMFDTWNNKLMSRLIPVCDKPTASADLNVSWTDDDYQTYNTARAIDLYQERPDLKQLGRFRKRAFKLTFTENQPFRISKLKVAINMGQS